MTQTVTIECTRGFGRVEHPETGESINVEEPFETDQETFELLNESYPGFRIVDELDDTQDDTDTYTCAMEKADGELCTREVDSPEGTCWQH